MSPENPILRFSDEEIREKASRISIEVLKIFSQNLNGNYRSLFRGQGPEFDQVREYQDGDELRMIDWNVTARIGHPFVKKFIEERDNSIMIALDTSGSQIFGSRENVKIERAAEITATISLLAGKNRDRIGYFAFSDDYEYFRPPQKKRPDWRRILYEILSHPCSGRSDHLSHSLGRLSQLLKKKSLLFLISDFQSEDDYEKRLSMLASSHQLICVITRDPLELVIKNSGLISVQDAETGEIVTVDTDDRAWQEECETQNRNRLEKLQTIFRKQNIDYFFLTPENDYLKEFLRIFGKKQRHR